jgi:hypothetical protein
MQLEDIQETETLLPKSESSKVKRRKKSKGPNPLSMRPKAPSTQSSAEIVGVSKKKRRKRGDRSASAL